MTYPTFSPPVNPQSPFDRPVTPRMIGAQIGTGNTSYAPDGINVNLMQVTLKFDPISQAQYNTIDSFITPNFTVPFFYTLPDETVARLWTLTARTRRTHSTTWGYEVSLAEQPII